jgi:putative Mg2+ transporter-C (MgtC) family protein
MEYFQSWGFQAICCVRLLVAAACGLGIGFERKNRLKEAGIRTHMIVALGAALMMIVSKYGFFDLVGTEALMKVDASRIASQIVTGVGFLGAGTIFIRNRSVTGLTTAAGVWATAGIGMAMGAGMYTVGIAGTGLVLLTQYWLHNSNWWNIPDACALTLRVNEDKGGVGDVTQAVREAGGQLVSMSVSHKKNGVMKLDLYIKLPAGVQQYEIVEKLEKQPFIAEVEE